MERKRMLRLETPHTTLLQPEVEVCMNPWNGVYRNSDVVLYILYEGRRLPICRKCWGEIASADVEWRCD